MTRVAPLLVVRDVPRALAFWRDAVGAEVLDEEPDYAHVRIGEGTLHLAEEGPPSPDKPTVNLVAPTDRTQAQAEVVLHVDDVHEWYARLTAAGFEFLAPPNDPEWGGERRAFLHDPDGHLIELTQVLDT